MIKNIASKLKDASIDVSIHYSYDETVAYVCTEGSLIDGSSFRGFGNNEAEALHNALEVAGEYHQQKYKALNKSLKRLEYRTD